MTEEQRAQLRDARNKLEYAKENIHNIETDLMDNSMKQRYLIHWKKWDWVGITITSIISLIAIGVTIVYANILLGSTLKRFELVNDTFTYSMGAALIPFVLALLILSLTATAFFGFKFYIQHGIGPVARKIAKKSRWKNYYNEMQKIKSTERLLQDSLQEIKEEARRQTAIISNLENLENPWNLIE